MEVTCTACDRTFTIPCTDEQYKTWRGGVLIQRAMPDVPPDLRELLISGTCGECFDQMFPAE